MFIPGREHTRYAGADFTGFQFVSRNVWGAVELAGSANFEGANFDGLKGFSEAHDLMWRVVMELHTETGREFWAFLAAIIRGESRPWACSGDEEEIYEGPVGSLVPQK